MLDLLNQQPRNHWIGLIAEGVAALAREIADKSIPVPDLVEWFAEWARDTRGEQRGLLLLTAHRAKGLEFDDVAILDSGWDRPSKGEDADAPRRLFYVAMTRARCRLAAMAQGAHPFLTPHDDLLIRTVNPDCSALQGRSEQYVMPDMKLVDLSWAGRLGDGNPSLRAIADCGIGDPVTLIRNEARWFIRDRGGNPLGRMSNAFSPPEGLTFMRGEIGAVIRGRKSDNADEYHSSIRRDEWEAVLPELVFG